MCTKNCKQSQWYTSRFSNNNTQPAVTSLFYVCCCVTAVLGITKYNKLHLGFFAINFLIEIKIINRD